MVKYKIDYDKKDGLYTVKRRSMLIFWKTYGLFASFSDAQDYLRRLIKYGHGSR